ncbi:hypothetical protein EDF58_102274 [Novosphingobium sp. PhB57]|nr:hypothetical protein EDF58_102274 [Novosphingobium sp. PhB57]TDW63757.1 hypothetical protein EDF57_105230 [Novosphingobium sp. PhB55]
MGPMTKPQARNTSRSARKGSPVLQLRMRTALIVLTVGAALGAGSGVMGQKRSLDMLDQLESGSWELRERGQGGSVNDVCVRSGRQLIQLRHAGLACNSVVVEDSPAEVVVQYTCAGQGYGRTRIRRETDALVQIDTQGIVNGLPFAYAGEGRRLGACRN